MSDGQPLYNVFEIISKKRDGLQLTQEEIKYMISGYVEDSIPDYQISSLLMAIYLNGLNHREMTELTEIMKHSGDIISLSTIPGKKIDKHSTGGVGDKISLIVAPLVAACGVKVPMLSGRALGHTGGTLDKLESIPGMNVFLTIDHFKQILKDVGMVISGQTENIVPADRKLYALRSATATIGSIPLITASIMSKKLALETDGIVLDVKTGSGAFMRNLEDAITLCQTMVAVGEKSGRPTIGLITNMDQPLGAAVGNSLEVIESIETLKGNGPQDVVTVTFGLAASMLMAAGVEKSYEQAIKKLKTVLKSGKPLEYFKRFISAQGGDAAICTDYLLLPQSKIKQEIKAHEEGYISKIDTLEVGLAANELGVGRVKREDKIDHSTGFTFHKKVGDRINQGDIILTIHSNSQSNIKSIGKRLRKAIALNNEKVPKPKTIMFLVDKNGIKEWPGN
jgi:pyrimidine-nucleoside phosphorylase